MLGSPSFEPEPAGWAEHDGHEPETSPGECLVDVEIDWHLAHFERTGSRLPDGVMDELTREARELLYLEWQVLEPERARIDHDGGRAAVSPNTVLQTREEVSWFRHLLDQLWQERSTSRTDRRRSIIDAVQAEAESLRKELADGAGADRSVIESVVDRYATRLSSRADDRAGHIEIDRTVRELTDKLRLLVGTAVLTDPPGAVARLTHHAQRDDSVRAAWSACAHDDVPHPSPACSPTVEVAPELFGRDPLRHLKLMLDPVGPVDARPVPLWLSSALRTPSEGSALRSAVEQEFRRATCPAGLADPALRARWFLAVLYAGSCWTAATLAAQVQHLADPDPAMALRRLIRAEPAPHTIDRVRGAALLQTGALPFGPVDPDGWRPSVAGIAFDGARSSRFAIPADVALEAAPLDTCGVRLRGYLGDDWANRAARFGQVGIEQLCEVIVARYHRKIHQRLLKDDQLTTGSLRDSTPTQWHAITTKQMRREAFTVLKRFRAGRPIMDDVPEPESPEPDEFEVLAGTLDPDVLVLLMAGPRASGILRDVTERWLASRHSRVGTAMDRRLAELLHFRVWFDDELRRAGSTAAVTAPILRRTEAPLRHTLHRFVLAGGHRPNGQGAITDDGPAPSDQAATRAAQRASQGMFKAVITMLIDLDLLPDRAGVTT